MQFRFFEPRESVPADSGADLTIPFPYGSGRANYIQWAYTDQSSMTAPG